MNKKKIPNIFGWLEEITLHKSPIDSISEESWDTWNNYMIHRFVSMNVNYVEIANHAQRFNPNDKRQTYAFYRDLVPKKKVFFKYIKPTSKSLNKELVEYITSYFECSKKEAEDLIPILGKEKIGSILSSIGLEEKEIKKLLK